MAASEHGLANNSIGDSTSPAAGPYHWQEPADAATTLPASDNRGGYSICSVAFWSFLLTQFLGAFNDNYLWVIHNGRHAAVVDPGDATPVIEYLNATGLELAAIICTHHHADHVGGVDHLLDFLNIRGKIPVYGPASERIPSRTQALIEGDRIVVPYLELAFEVIDVPGHTAGHIAYFGHGMC